MPSILPKSLQRRPWLLTVLAGLLAYFLCLRADFYMDDFMFVVDSTGTGTPRRFFYFFGLFTIGDTSTGSYGAGITELLPTLVHYIRDVVAGTSPVAAHAVNLVLHLGTALMLCFKGRDVLIRLGAFGGDAAQCATAALMGSILFACHPYASEAVNYAKCIKIQMVALFAIWFAAAWLEMLQKPDTRAVRAALVSGLLLSLSYHPGIFLGFSMAALLTLANPERMPFAEAVRSARELFRRMPRVRRRLLLALGVPFLAGMAIWVSLLVHGQLGSRLGHYPEHLLTQGRMIWGYLWRFFAPVKLSSDHLILTSIPGEDHVALVLTLAFALLFLAMCGGAVLLKPGLAKRLCILTLLWLGPLAIRFTYVNREPMVEYRVYPALTWFCLIAGMGLAWCWQRRRLASLTLATSLAMTGILMSAARSHLWRDRSVLAMDVLKQYPTNTRAMVHLIANDYDTGHYEDAMFRHNSIGTVWEILRRSPKEGPRARDVQRLDTSLVESCQFAAMAMAELQGSKPALDWAEKTEADLRAVMPERFKTGGVEAFLSVRDTLRDHGAEIDARRAQRTAAPAG